VDGALTRGKGRFNAPIKRLLGRQHEVTFLCFFKDYGRIDLYTYLYVQGPRGTRNESFGARILKCFLVTI
jgi:hypothetical protein